jgi:hypothetical protein
MTSRRSGDLADSGRSGQRHQSAREIDEHTQRRVDGGCATEISPHVLVANDRMRVGVLIHCKQKR